MIMQVDPEWMAALDPRKSYLPVMTPTEGEETAGASRVREQTSAPSDRAALAMPAHDSHLDDLSTQDLRAELHRRQQSVSRLRNKRDKLLADIAALDQEIQKLLGTGPRAAPAPRDPNAPRRPARLVTPRPKNSLGLADAIAAAVEPGQVVSPTEAAELVKQGGYVTTSKTFRQAVSTTLAKHDGFRRVGRGRYERTA